MGRKDYPKALENYSEAIRLKPDGSYAPHAHLGSGIAYLAMGDMVAAEKEFNEAIAFDHEIKITMRARFEIANNRIREKNYMEAAKGFMRVAILYDDPKYTPLALYKAGECFVRIQRTEDAMKAFEELKTRYPNSKWAKKTHV
jgi:TolA-binding protein